MNYFITAFFIKRIIYFEIILKEPMEGFEPPTR